MKETITICESRDGKLYPINKKKMTVQLDKEKMETFVIYKKQRYAVQGNIYLSYIVIE